MSRIVVRIRGGGVVEVCADSLDIETVAIMDHDNHRVAIESVEFDPDIVERTFAKAK